MATGSGEGVIKRHFASALMIAAGVGISGVAVAQEASFGCWVLLCSANPQGPMSAPDCRPKMKKLYRDLAKGKAFPTCTEANSVGLPNGIFARVGMDYFDPCAEGTVAARGLVALAGERKTRLSSGGIAAPGAESGVPGPMACVGKKVGSRYTGGGEGGDIERVDIFDSVVWQTAKSPRVIDVILHGKLFNRSRF